MNDKLAAYFPLSIMLDNLDSIKSKEVSYRKRGKLRNKKQF